MSGTICFELLMGVLFISLDYSCFEIVRENRIRISTYVILQVIPIYCAGHFQLESWIRHVDYWLVAEHGNSISVLLRWIVDHKPVSSLRRHFVWIWVVQIAKPTAEIYSIHNCRCTTTTRIYRLESHRIKSNNLYKGNLNKSPLPNSNQLRNSVSTTIQVRCGIARTEWIWRFVLSWA